MHTENTERRGIQEGSFTCKLIQVQSNLDQKLFLLPVQHILLVLNKCIF